VTYLVTTTSVSTRPSVTTSDCRSPLICGNQTCTDLAKQNHGAWQKVGGSRHAGLSASHRRVPGLGRSGTRTRRPAALEAFALVNGFCGVGHPAQPLFPLAASTAAAGPLLPSVRHCTLPAARPRSAASSRARSPPCQRGGPGRGTTPAPALVPSGRILLNRDSARDPCACGALKFHWRGTGSRSHFPPGGVEPAAPAARPIHGLPPRRGVTWHRHEPRG
jgi:hypothetical protein